MVMFVDKRLLWHPRRENRFVVGGASQITLYEWKPEIPEIRHITSQHDLQLMKCFAWSPDPVLDDLIAVGLSTGKVDLMRLEATRSASDNILSSGPSVSLPVRSSRSCNALAFCPVDPSYLAVGLDKVRGDSSLVIWNVGTATPILSFAEPASSTVVVESAASRNTMTPPVIPRAEYGPKTDSRIVQQHAPTEIVSSLAFSPQSSCLLWAGISNRWLRLFDLRTVIPSVDNVSSKVQSIATDPFDTNRVGTFCDGTVSVWDSRRLSHPLVTFTGYDASSDNSKSQLAPSTFTTLEFSPVRRGVLATLEKDASHVRFWDLQEAQPSELSLRERSRESSRSGSARPGGRLSWANPTSMLSWTSSTGSNVSSGGVLDSLPAVTSNVVLSDTRTTKTFASLISSFSLVPTDREHPLTSNVMVVNKKGDLEVYAVHDTPNHSRWSNYGDLTMAVGTSYRVFAGFSGREEGPKPWGTPALPPKSRSSSHGRQPGQDWKKDQRQSGPDPIPSTRGRSQSIDSPPTLGRGEEEGFLPLNASVANVVVPSPILEETKTITGSHRNASFSHALNSLIMRSHSADKGGKPHVQSPDGEQEAFAQSSVDKLALHSGQDFAHHQHRPHRHSSKSKHVSSIIKMRQVVMNDISMSMRRRALKGYGLRNLSHNSFIANEDPILSELWLWINYWRYSLYSPNPRINGFDFSCKGLLGIWEGFPPSLNHMAHDVVPPPSPAAGLKSLFMENTPSDMGQFGRSHSKQAKSRRQPHPSTENGGTTSRQREDFTLAVSILSGRHGDHGAGPDLWKPVSPTSKLAQRRFGLQLCGWSLREEQLDNAIHSWELANKHSQAACWLVFTKQYRKAMELLMRSQDESHYLISGMLAALTQQNTGSGMRNNSDLRQYCERLIVRLQDPYLRAMLTHLTANDWSEVLDEESIPLRERLAIALQFLDDKSLSSYLRRVADKSIVRGDISGIIVTGLTSTGMDILQSYVDITGDIQTAAILSCFRSASAVAASDSELNGNSEDARNGKAVDRWIETYQDLLDEWKMFYHRCQFDIDRGKLIQDAIRDGEIQSYTEWVPRQIMIRCNFCGKNIDVANSKSRGTSACSNCGRGLPRCSICLMTLTISPDPIRSASLTHKRSQDTIYDAIVFCQTCRHGGHASHIVDWFFGDGCGGGDSGGGDGEYKSGAEDGVRRRRAHDVCPVADCNCHCATEL